MDKTINFYKHCVKKVLSEYTQSSPAWTKTELVFDDNRMHYLVMRVGWYKGKRVHRCLIHLDVCDDTIVIQANNTENLLKTELVTMGIPEDKICLGFIPPEVEQWSQSTLTPPLFAPVDNSINEEAAPVPA